MRIIHSKSLPIPVTTEKTCTDPIFLITQFFLHRDKNRRREIQYCLQKNCENPSIHTIYLLNEKIYTEEELGVSDQTSNQKSKIKQINIHTWITFKHIFDFIESESLHGFVVTVNCDIMLDHTIEKLQYSDIHQSKSMIALLRYEYDDVYVPFETNCDQAKLFGPRGDSQDTWIIHTNQNIPSERRAMFAFPFGKPGCDNKMVFLFHMLGYQVYNDPKTIKTYHFHRTQNRDYKASDRLNPVFEYLCPYGIDDMIYHHVPIHTRDYRQWNLSDSSKFYKFLGDLVDRHIQEPFVIPVVDNLIVNGERLDQVFSRCDYYFSRDVYNEEMKVFGESENYIGTKFSNKIKLWESLRNIPYFIFHDPWTLALQNKRLLIVSPYAEEIFENHSFRAYPVPIFKNNMFEFVKWIPEKNTEQMISKTRQLIQDLVDAYDIALIDAGDCTNMVANDVYTLGKSAISVGSGLSLMFGMYTDVHVQTKEYSDFFKGFKNEYWMKVG